MEYCHVQKLSYAIRHRIKEERKKERISTK
jgi:hypothetical protein